MYESKKSPDRDNISLFESFSMEFLHKSEKKLKFIDLLNLDSFNQNMLSLFGSISPLTEVYLIPWKLNQSNVEAFVVAVNYSLAGENYRTCLRVYQFDDAQEVGFMPYLRLELQGKPVQLFQGNESVHLSLTNREENQLISVMPANLLTEQAIVLRNSFNKSCEFLLWDQDSELLVYILEANPFIFYAQRQAAVAKVDMTEVAVQSTDIAATPLKMSLIREREGYYLIVTFLALRKNSIALKYLQYQLAEGGWTLTRSGLLSPDIGVNPKEYVRLQTTQRTAFYYSWEHRLYLIAANRLYIVELDSGKHSTLSLRDNCHLDKIVSLDKDFRLLLKYREKQSPETTVLDLVLLDNTYQEVLRQEIDKFEDCYDVAVQLQDQSTYSTYNSEFCLC